jgi:FAD synthetase
VFGTFDIIHPSHLRFLLEARNAVDCQECELVVIVARDSSIQRIKGHKSIFHEDERLKLVSGLRIVDFARLGNEGKDHYEVILEVNPDFIVLGYDQVRNDQPLRDFIQNHNLGAEIARLPKFESGDLTSSSEVREKVLEIIYEKNKEKKQ